MLFSRRRLRIFIALALSSLTKPAFAEIKTQMNLFSDSFISSAFEATKKTNYQFIGAAISSDPASNEALQMDISAANAFGEPLLNYLNVSEFNYHYKIADDQNLILGRKKLNWSTLDSRWNLGVWQPVFKWNPLSPEAQGLTGLFWQVDRSMYQLTLFASTVYLPDQGPSYEISNGEFVRSNPWFHRPPDSIHIFGQNTLIEYNLQKPNESQVVFQTSYGAKLNFGDPEWVSMQLSHIYKPANQLALGYNGVLDIPKDRGVVDIQPQVFYHSLTGGDLNYKYGLFKTGVSILYDNPNKDNIFDSQWTHPVFSPATMTSEFAEINLRFFDFYLQHLDIVGGDITEVGALASSSRPSLMTRYPYKQANEVGIKGHVGFGKNRRLESAISYTRSDKNDFSLLKFKTYVKVSKLWNFYGEMQLIDAGALTVDNQNDIAQYANNDRLMIGVGYVF